VRCWGGALLVSSYAGNGTAASPSLNYGYDAVGNRATTLWSG